MLPWPGSGGPRLIVRATIIRPAVEQVPATTRPPKVLWLWWAAPAGVELDLDLLVGPEVASRGRSAGPCFPTGAPRGGR
jgi:hypothetical protein